MIDGSFVQELDITKISSMRRNRVISDIFNRLYFMERRGSGLTRIVESYYDFNLKPSFYSDISSFKVVFPNKNLLEKLDDKEENLSTIGNIVSDEDYFMIKMHKNLPNNIRKNTYNQVQKLFNQYTYCHDFRREDIESIFQIKKSRASEIISLLLECNLIENSEPTKYRFKK